MAGIRTKRDIDDILAAHPAAGLTFTDAAARANVSERTVRRRLETPAFRKRVDVLKSEAVGRAVAMMAESMAAASKLIGLVDSEDEKIALTAARTVLETGLKLRQAEEVERKLQELSDRLDALTNEGESRGQAKLDHD